MAKRDRTVEQLDALSALKSTSDPSLLRPALIEALDDKVNLVVARAAELARKKELADLAGALAGAFGRFMLNCTKSDPGCAAKTAIVEALVHFNADQRDLYLTGLHHEQHEGVWGGSRDTAAKLRGLSALGLVALGYKDILYELADLLFDEDPEARQLAARAAGGTGTDSAALLLRAKLAAAKDSAEIYGECFASLLSLQPNRSLDYIARFLTSDDPQLVEAAALSIGSSRSDRAFDLLRLAYDDGPARVEAIAALLLGMAMTRKEAAVALLIEEMSDLRAGAEAVSALRIFRNDPTIAARVEKALATANNPTLSRRWRSG